MAGEQAVDLTFEERAAFEQAIAQPGWYVLLRVGADGFRRLPVGEFKKLGREGAITHLNAVSSVPEHEADALRDVLGRFTAVGAFHPDFFPDPEDRG